MNQALLYDYAMSFVGLPYKWGGDDTIDGFDCSGLVLEILQAFGVVPHGYDTTAEGLFRRFKGTKPSVLTADLGTLAFYRPQHESRVVHCGFCLDNERMLHAGGGGSKTKTRKDAADQNAFVMIRPIRYRGDLVALFNPDYGKPTRIG